MADTLTLDILSSSITVTDHEANGTAEWAALIRVAAPIQIVRTVLVECGHGGYAFAVQEEAPPAGVSGPTLLGQGPTISADTMVTWRKFHVEPMTALHVYCRYIDSSDPSVEKVALLTLPIGPATTLVWNSAVEWVPTLREQSLPKGLPQGDVQRGVFLTAMAPVDVVDILTKRDGALTLRRVFVLTGQILSLRDDQEMTAALQNAGKPLDGWHLAVHDDGAGVDVIDRGLRVRDDWPGWGGRPFGQGAGFGAWFTFALDLPATFSFGSFRMTFRLGGLTLTYDGRTAFEAADVLHLPMDPQDYLFADAQVNFGSGPAVPGGRSHPHNGTSNQRYAYDLGAYVDGFDVRPGQSGTLGAYWSFGSPILAVADGVVTRVEMGDADQLPSSGRGNRITIRHDHRDGPRYSVYAHCRQDSARVSVGEAVRAGQQIAEVGCTGDSGSPHLHLSYYEFDGWARLRAVPMAFTVSAGGDEAVTGVPESDLRLDPPRGQGNANPGVWGVIVATVREIAQAIVRGWNRLVGG